MAPVPGHSGGHLVASAGHLGRCSPDAGAGAGAASDGQSAHRPAAHRAAWSRTFPATPRNVGQARVFLGTILGASSACRDAALCLSELATNAVTHSNSRHPGGDFTVQVTLIASRLRVEIHDAGGPWNVHPGHDATGGRGLQIVGNPACARGRTGHWQTRCHVSSQPQYPPLPTTPTPA